MVQSRLYVQDLSEETQFMIAGRATPVKVAPGHEICSQGDPADCIWLLHEGTHDAVLGSLTAHCHCDVDALQYHS